MNMPTIRKYSPIHGTPSKTSPWATLLDVEVHDGNIVVVDDEPMIVDVVRTFLGGVGYDRVTTFTDPVKALEFVRRDPPDLVITDVNMPEISGLELLREIRSDSTLGCLPVIVLTAISDRNLKVRALDMGATEFLTKPVDAIELITRVRNTLVMKAYQNRLGEYIQLLEHEVGENSDDDDGDLAAASNLRNDNGTSNGDGETGEG